MPSNRPLLLRLLRYASHVRWQIEYRYFRKRYSISPAFRFNGRGILLYGEGRIDLGPDSYIGEHSTIQAAPSARVVVGRGCRLSHNVRIYTQTNVADMDFSSVPIEQKVGDVEIGDYCWIGANVFINPGVRIGSNAVVGANAVVTKDIGAWEIWGGTPARLIRRKRTAPEPPGQS